MHSGEDESTARPPVCATAPQSEDRAGGAAPEKKPDVRVIALLGNPNTGKTTLFNRISGLRHKTSNFPGTTLEARVARVRAGVEGGRDADLIDMPGLYSIELDQLESRVCREVLGGQAAPGGGRARSPECAVVVVDATNLARNLMLVGEVLRRRLPTVVVLNMSDLAEKRGVRVNSLLLGEALGCEVVRAVARSGEGIDEVRHAIRRARIPTPNPPIPGSSEELRHWAEDMFERVVPGASGGVGGGVAGEAGALHPPDNLEDTHSDWADRVLLHPVAGAICFALVMTGLFYAIFSLAQFPMAAIEWLFARGTTLIEAMLPAGALRELLAEGVIGGVGSTLVFLPQICLLFFLISLLEDSGYLARGAFLMDRLLRPFGLPGQAFVPLLSSHACALPGIMATRGIPDLKERLATILVAPFMTCSARLPVYVLLTSLLFVGRPALAALAFVGCYALGIVAGVFSALIARRTILRGVSRPMAMELPSYKWPSLRSAFITTIDRAWTFIRKAGTNILMICIALWWLGAYPHSGAPQLSTDLVAAAARVENGESSVFVSSAENNHAYRIVHDEVDAPDADQPGIAISPDGARELAAQAESKHHAQQSFLGRIGRALQPAFAPLGFDRQLTIGVLASFAAREVFVSTMSVVITGAEDTESEGVMDQLASATRDDGRTPVFTRPVCWSLLVFFVLAMQCLPTLAVTARESGHVKWAILQLVWMSALAYISAAFVFHVLS